MSWRVKVIGAGSIGNHLAHAARSLDWSVDMCDVDEKALVRTKDEIYPMRYGAWDERISLYPSGQVPKNIYDLIIIGTPPDSHIPLALQVLKENPKAVLIEKPLCGPNLEGADELFNASIALKIPVFIGYDHAIGEAARIAVDSHLLNGIGAALTIDVEFREFWGGIFKAHPWLSGPADTYLGFSNRGGGALGEHSHALNLWQLFAKKIGAGRIQEVQASMSLIQTQGLDYDSLCLLNLRTENGLLGRCVQDVVTSPPRKWARIQGDKGSIEWECQKTPGIDCVKAQTEGENATENLVKKSRPDDFINELKHIKNSLSHHQDSDISLVNGLDTMLAIAAAHLSHTTKSVVRIDYDRGYTMDALSILN